MKRYILIFQFNVKKKIIKGKKIKRVYIFRYQHREKETVQKQYHNGIPLKSHTNKLVQGLNNSKKHTSFSPTTPTSLPVLVT